MSTEMERRILDLIDEQEIVDFAVGFTDVFSPTGFEADAANFCYDHYVKMGLRAKLQEISEERFNAIGVLPGIGGGLHLMFNGHLDISHTGREGDVPGEKHSFARRQNLETEPLGMKTVVEDGWIRGNGIRNMKSVMAAYIGAVSAIIRSGVKLKGDIMIAAVAGEIEKSPVDDFQGREYRGYGEGTRYALVHGGVADMCVLGEPTKFEVHLGNFGSLWLKLTARGDLVPTAWCDQVGNCIESMSSLVRSLRNWIERYRERSYYFGRSPGVNVGAIQGGWPWRLSRTPTYCHLYLDIRFPPSVHPLDIIEEIKNVIRDEQKQNPTLEVEIEPLVTMPPTEIPREMPVVQAIIKAHKSVLGEDPVETFHGPETDAAHLNRYGIPTVIYGPAGRNRPGVADYVYGWQSVDDLVKAARVYALTALDICMRGRQS